MAGQQVSFRHDWYHFAMRGMGAAMTNSPQNRNVMAGGAPLALLTLAGPFLAGSLGYSPSIGLVAGFGLGVVVAIAIYLVNSR